ncbi:MAG: glycosyltransferase family 4 protein [Burkholderiales bacterium]|nr:glycosyltransferase family 4 protein [Burkholderiales bacterium]
MIEAPRQRHLVLVVHQSAELYGSDRSLLDALTGLDRARYELVVCLPEEGPLKEVLIAAQFEVHVVPLAKIERRMISPRGLFILPAAIHRAISALDRVVAGRRVDIVYSNTLAVLGGAAWARKMRLPHVWHVREIVRRPALASFIFRHLARWGSTCTISNSHSTLEWISGQREPTPRARVVWNGFEAAHSRTDDRRANKQQLGFDPDKPLILMVGRVNAWKGQDLLVEALGDLCRRAVTGWEAAIVGGPPPGREDLIQSLRAQIGASPATAQIRTIAFTQDVACYYAAADLLVVPSREPEPFGRVAIEAMAYGLPVVAARHGGLPEIVEEGQTGLLFHPNEASSLADALANLIAAPNKLEAMGHAARERQQKLFSLSAYHAGMNAVFSDMLAAQAMRSTT